MKINFIIPSTVLGGGIRVIFLYCNYLASKGHDVICYAPMIFDWPDIKLSIKTSIGNTLKRGIKVSWMKCNFKIKLTPHISSKFIRNADIAVATAWYTARAVYNLSDNKGKKVYFIQEHEVNKDKSDIELVDNTFKLDMNRIIITNKLSKYIADNYQVDSIVIHNGILESEYLNEKKEIHNPKCVIMLGNLAFYKGGRNGIEILERIQEKYNIRVILYGTKYIDDLPDNFEFYKLPERKKLMQLYKEADICLFPSIDEGWGLTVTEAMANRCAIVGNNTGVVSEICEHGKNALIAKDLNKGKLESYLEELINDDELLMNIQLGGYELAKTLRWENSFQKFEAYLKRLISDRNEI